ncbi:GNAT family N-acetyltransferase [Cellulomonas denverensis]|uniref:GNAT family N-acetyltransferase n=1 Tax=Cellulomonas denverensis TaxID=264297 RepID=A0A7X6KVU7_9CELL|nr:GNAT family N-acetyltransferase [Cellulomonas denverensis]NKY23207.1 GNAT family N-acetyltransferase [Cellulomonas denverensis]GIG26719.1 ElaA protein [Cellulomonas denverensis]
MSLRTVVRRSDQITAAELYPLLRLRVDVFVVEQTCPYPDLDGLDLLPDTLQVWAEEDGEVLGCIRVLRHGSDTPAIGRVATAPAARGRGVAGGLLERGIELCGPAAAIHLHAQEHLEHWYGRYGFVRDGATYDEDGIPHVPMIRRP